MKTLNEQIEKLRELIRKAYGAVAAKGGNVPEAGERTMENLSAAIESVPQTYSPMVELTATENNKEYLPAEYGVEGFSKVTTEIDMSNLPKAKVSILKVSNGCIDADGRWRGDSIIDFSSLTNIDDSFNGCSKLTSLQTNTWDTSNIQSMNNTFRSCSFESLDCSSWDVSKLKVLYSTFISCSKLRSLDVSTWDTSALSAMIGAFGYNPLLEMLDLTSWKVFNVTDFSQCFTGDKKLSSLIGYKTIEYVIENDIKCLDGASKSLYFVGTILDRASLRAVINGLADLTDSTSQTLALGTTLLAKLTEEDIAIATNKNWTLS